MANASVDFDRRTLLAAAGCSVLSTQRLAAAPAKPISLAGINHMKINVSDLVRSLEWYQSLFGMSVVAQQGETLILQVGEGPTFLAIASDPATKPGIVHIGLSIANFDAEALLSRLDKHGLKSSRELTPMQAHVQTRGADGIEAGTKELFLRDPDGIVLQLQDEKYCGGVGPLGDKCREPKVKTQKTGRLAVEDYNHFTTFVSDQVRSVAFYQRLFRLPIDAWQGQLPILRVGTGNQFLAFLGVSTRPAFQAYIHHACFTVKQFDPDRVLAVLADHEVRPRANSRSPVEPLRSYITLRMPDRGGAVDGTPELYFTDPDGIVLQIQDVRYSGGSGYLGDVRGTPQRD